MSQRTIAIRYARALLEVAVKESNPEKVEQDLASFNALVESHPDLKRVMTSRSVSVDGRSRVVEQVASKSGAAAITVKLLVLLAARGRLALLPDLLDVYRQQLLAHSNIVRGAVASAVPLSPDKVRSLEQSLADATGKQVQFDETVDPSLIGGIVARIGGTVYDGSIRTQLQKMKQQLVEGS